MKDNFRQAVITINGNINLMLALNGHDGNKNITLREFTAEPTIYLKVDQNDCQRWD